VKGTYDLAEGGFFETAIRSLTGAPVDSVRTSTITTTAQAEAMWQTIKDALTNGWFVASGTDGSSNT
jgi:S-methylmethionine-dependent homocysteine/selenocysteine methylase